MVAASNLNIKHFRQYKSAISDFSICINLDETYADAYLQRAKCEFIQGDST